MDKFRVGLSIRFRRPDGSPAIPEFDLSPLTDDPRMECIDLPDVDRLSHDDLASMDAVILGLEGIDAGSFAGDDRLALVARFGVGYDRIQVPECTANGVALAITPDGVRRPVAVAVITFMLALTTKLMAKDRITREGASGWARKTDFNGVGLVGRKLGSLGIGNIGAEVFRLAKPFDMELIAHDPYADSELAASLEVRLVSLEDLFREADVLTINCPLTTDTRGIVNDRLLDLMKPTAYLINTARGPIVDQAALTRALRDRRIAGAGLDVLHLEPPEEGEPLLELDNVILAPHALCWTDQCMAGNGAADVRAVKAVMGGEAPDFVVNREVMDDPRFRAKLESYASRWS
jgi:D-3-phosphoglycerate dehydrogenase